MKTFDNFVQLSDAVEKIIKENDISPEIEDFVVRGVSVLFNPAAVIITSDIIFWNRYGSFHGNNWENKTTFVRKITLMEEDHNFKFHGITLPKTMIKKNEYHFQISINIPANTYQYLNIYVRNYYGYKFAATFTDVKMEEEK